MLKIRRTANGDVVLTVSGRLEVANVGEISALIDAERPGQPLVLDLEDVVLADPDSVRFLRSCEREGVVLRNCPPFIRAWIARQTEDGPEGHC
jgi:hypothetical protein